MYLEKLGLSGLRNLSDSRLNFSPRLNLLYGANGSGKTSLLEGVWLLGRGRSFRTRHLSSIICQGADHCIVNGEVRVDSGESRFLGLSRNRNGDFQFKVGRESVRNSSALAAVLPLLLIDADSFSLLDGGPGRRRRFLDWLVFHVEPLSRPVWVEFSHVIKQRNSLLRRGKIASRELPFWDESFVRLSEQVKQYREAWMPQLFGQALTTLKELSGVEGIDFSFQHGWKQEASLADELHEVREREIRRGMTLVGPQRADISITLNGRKAKETLSRGQSKALVSAMQIARARVLAEATGSNPVALVDDLPAELDELHRELVVKGLLNSGAQVFVTGVKLDEFFPKANKSSWKDLAEAAVFHVEHGEINAVS